MIYWIFIAIGLFAALSFAVSKINRTGSTKMEELAQLRATDIMQYAGAVQRGVRIMRINGAEDDALCFHAAQWGHTLYDDSSDDNDCGSNKNLVFHPAGGGISFQTPVDEWYDQDAAVANSKGQWVFSARYEVIDVGTNDDAADGATDTDAGSADLLMATAPLKLEICEAINRMLGLPVAVASVTAGTYDALATSPFNTDDESYADGTGNIAALGRERCVKDGSTYMYYKVILAR